MIYIVIFLFLNIAFDIGTHESVSRQTSRSLPNSTQPSTSAASLDSIREKTNELPKFPNLTNSNEPQKMSIAQEESSSSNNKSAQNLKKPLRN